MVAEDEASKIGVDSYQDPILGMCDAEDLFVARIAAQIAAFDNVMAAFPQPSANRCPAHRAPGDAEH